LVSTDGTILGRGRSDYRTEAIRACLEDAGLSIAPLSEWVVSSPSSPTSLGPNRDITFRAETIGTSTLYTTLEPSTRRRGTATPPVTNLIRAAQIHRVVIGCPSPVPEKAMMGATVLHDAGIEVRMMDGDTLATSLVREQCENLIVDFTKSANCKLQRMARKHFQLFGRPLGFMHCSVINSENVEAFSRLGNAFGTNFGPATLSFRNLGAYELAPPPDVIWADEMYDDDSSSNNGYSTDTDQEFVTIEFEDEDFQGDMNQLVSPMMPWYSQVDAVVGTFPRSGNGPPDDDSITARLNGLKWLATHGNKLPAGVERILVLDATELRDLPLSNDDPNLPKGVDVEAFWAGKDRKPTRVLLRRGVHEAARAAANAAVIAAQAAAHAAKIAADAIESGDAANAAAAAIECEAAATASKEYIQRELELTQVLRRKLETLGVVVETLEGGEPIDVMHHLGERNGLYSVVWRAGCWGERGVRAILAGAFQWVSAHLAVPAEGGRFWQLMMAENAVQAACGPQSKVKVFADQDDISMEYCDNVDVDDDCVISVEGKPIRHVRLDCRIALVDEHRPREFDIAKTQKISRKVLVEQAPWFL
jgi:pyrimidine deaminase RibD-like protein